MLSPPLESLDPPKTKSIRTSFSSTLSAEVVLAYCSARISGAAEADENFGGLAGGDSSTAEVESLEGFDLSFNSWKTEGDQSFRGFEAGDAPINSWKTEGGQSFRGFEAGDASAEGWTLGAFGAGDASAEAGTLGAFGAGDAAAEAGTLGAFGAGDAAINSSSSSEAEADRDFEGVEAGDGSLKRKFGVVPVR